MWMTAAFLPADSQPKSTGLVWGLAATWRWICIHHMNRVNSRNGIMLWWQHHNYRQGYYYYYYKFLCYWYCKALLSYDRPEDLHQAVGILYSVFHLDIDNLTLSLLGITLPNLLLQSLSATDASLSSSFNNRQVQASTAGRSLSDPRGGALAKLCVLCINLMCSMRKFAWSSGQRTSEYLSQIDSY